MMKTLRYMLMGLSLAVVFLLSAAAAQDVMKVAPESHKVLLENDQVRVLSVHMKPGDKAPMHSHPHNVAYFLTDARVKITLPNGKTEERNLKAGSSNWSEATTHAAENIGTTELEEIQIELKK
jgi:quercetin dioxygenase-like cupin family protein